MTNALQMIYKNDQILRNMLGFTKQKLDFPRGLASDLEVHCSLSFCLNQPPETGNVQSVLLTVDAVGVLRAYT